MDYQQQHICALKDSTAVIPCSFYYPVNLIVKRVMWGHERDDVFEGPFIFDSEHINTSSRFQYIGDKQHNCSLNIRQVEQNDAGQYSFRVITDAKDGKWTGAGGSTLKVVGKF